jgi:solute carrier family 35 (UDP-sugar transporter), member A1/2/3
LLESVAYKITRKNKLTHLSLSLHKDWSIQSWLTVAGLPAIIYAVQNYCALMAYQNLPPITFNVLNQTKTLSAALCCYLILGMKQSPIQILSLLVLLLSALVIEKVVPLPGVATTATSSSSSSSSIVVVRTEARNMEIVTGVIPVLTASFLSGLAGALSQKSLQTMGRNSYLFTMELCAASIVVLLSSLLLNSSDAKVIREKGFFHNWTFVTWIPVVTNALGGIIVGLVTKYAGSVRKGFALIFGLLISGILQSKGEGITSEQVVGGIFAATSLWMHCSFPLTN